MTYTTPRGFPADPPAGPTPVTGPSDSGASSATLVDGILTHRALVLMCGLGLAALVSGLTWLTSPGAVAQGQLGLSAPATGNVLLPLPAGDATMARYTAQRALFAKSDVVLDEVAATVPNTSLQELRSAVAVTPSKTANALLVSASADSPETAVSIAQTVMLAYRTQTARDVAKRSEDLAAAYEARGDEARARQAVLEGEAFGDGVEFEVSPTLGAAQSRRVITRESLVALVVGLGMGAMAAWVIEDAARRRRAAREVG